NYVDTGDQIPPPLPLPSGPEALWAGGQRGATCLREAASAKAGERFSEKYVCSIMVPLITQ
ncbi:MAG: hypothetical protein MUP41_20935, partial [Desulfobacterales bacterium]|nr:hypothetical protein [Desulfobacterales bacterium]